MTEPRTDPMSTTPTPAREMNGLAVASFSVAMVGLCSPLGILGLIMGYVARGQIRERNNSGEGLAKASIILGWISIIAFILLLVLGIAGGIFAAISEGEWDKNYN